MGEMMDKNLEEYWEKGAENRSNPKDLIGRNKVPLSLAPPIALAYMAHAFSDGARKYGPYNWRNYSVEARVYVDACLRHIHAWFEGEEIASDSGVHHLGHALACLAIILDAESNEKLIDNRPHRNKAYPYEMEALAGQIKEKNTPKILTEGLVSEIPTQPVIKRGGGYYKTEE